MVWYESCSRNITCFLIEGSILQVSQRLRDVNKLLQFVLLVDKLNVEKEIYINKIDKNYTE